MRIRALFTKICIHSWTCRNSIREDATFHRMNWCKFLWVILARQSKHSATGTFASRTSGSRCISLIMPRRRSRRKIRLCCFCTFVDTVTKTAIVSFRTLPVGFPLPTISQSSLFTLFCPLILDHGVCLIISVLASIFLIRRFCSILLSPLSSICDNQVLLSSDESPNCTIPTRSWVSQPLVLLICTILPRSHQMGFASLTIEFRPISNRIPEYQHVEEQL